MRGVRDTALAFDRACRKAGIRYAFMGGMAVLAWGQPRTTEDVGALVDLPAASIAEFVAALSTESLTVTADDFRDALRDRSHVTIFDEASRFHVDAVIARSPGEREEVERAARVELGDGALSVVAPEDTIVFKVRFGSPQDLQDARSILVRQAGRLDRARLEDVAERLGVAEALADLERELASLEEGDA